MTDSDNKFVVFQREEDHVGHFLKSLSDIDTVADLVTSYVEKRECRRRIEACRARIRDPNVVAALLRLLEKLLERRAIPQSWTFSDLEALRFRRRASSITKESLAPEKEIIVNNFGEFPCVLGNFVAVLADPEDAVHGEPFWIGKITQTHVGHPSDENRLSAISVQWWVGAGSGQTARNGDVITKKTEPLLKALSTKYRLFLFEGEESVGRVTYGCVLHEFTHMNKNVSIPSVEKRKIHRAFLPHISHL